jgi:uncharacterized protein (DUF4415 family)
VRIITAGYLRGRFIVMVWAERDERRHFISIKHGHEREEKVWADKRVDPDDAPELTAEYFARAEVPEGEKIVRRGRWSLKDAKQLVTIRFPPATLANLRTRGLGWQKFVVAVVKKELA